eukprot:TRINITY_DN23671_c0_g1_i1.p1 TRINITY_DN23671_c0_g1~~TRINITY_DN23671_c0_g1_i1.p1  ORF type:complete len:291 (+),score=50.23 TRINITY_DN23671_c0_g1_i1:218-1090(+)
MQSFYGGGSAGGVVSGNTDGGRGIGNSAGSVANAASATSFAAASWDLPSWSASGHASTALSSSFTVPTSAIDTDSFSTSASATRLATTSVPTLVHDDHSSASLPSTTGATSFYGATFPKLATELEAIPFSTPVGNANPCGSFTATCDAAKNIGRTDAGVDTAASIAEAPRLTPAPPGSSARAAAEAKAFRAWLLCIDPTGALVRYQRTLEEHYDTTSQVVKTYTLRRPSTPSIRENGYTSGSSRCTTGSVVSLDPLFFDDMGVEEEGHRILFRQWFERECGSSEVRPLVF